jgi:EAL domain-containing protein (putative c-di-GMP-specific phosphodiesterase class I)
MYITKHSNVTDRTVLDAFWKLYEVSYLPLAEADPSRELLFRSEFDAVLADPTNRITVLRDENHPIAMSVAATDISSTRYLSRAFFERTYPERMAAGLVHYVMWIVVHPDNQASKALFHLARAGLAQEQEEGALVVFDLPESNQPDEQGGAAELLRRLASLVGPVSLESFGATRYYALDFAPVATKAAPAAVGGERVTA